METQTTNTKRRFKTTVVYISIIPNPNDSSDYDKLELINNSLAIRDFLYSYLKARGCGYVSISLLNSDGLLKVSFGNPKTRIETLKEEIKELCQHDDLAFFERYPLKKDTSKTFEDHTNNNADILNDLIKDVKTKEVKNLGSEDV